MFILKRKEDGKMVAKEGQDNSYTDSIFNAKIFSTRAEALSQACGNEHIVDIGYNDLLNR